MCSCRKKCETKKDRKTFTHLSICSMFCWAFWFWSCHHLIYGSNKKFSINLNTNNSIAEATVTGLAKSVAQCPRVLEFSSQAAKMKHRPARRDI